MQPAQPSRVCQTCKHCQPPDKTEGLGLFCESPDVLRANDGKSPTSIFWAVLKFCGDGRTFWEKA
jgi:hypothetical protein